MPSAKQSKLRSTYGSMRVCDGGSKSDQSVSIMGGKRFMSACVFSLTPRKTPSAILSSALTLPLPSSSLSSSPPRRPEHMTPCCKAANHSHDHTGVPKQVSYVSTGYTTFQTGCPSSNTRETPRETNNTDGVNGAGKSGIIRETLNTIQARRWCGSHVKIHPVQP